MVEARFNKRKEKLSYTFDEKHFKNLDEETQSSLINDKIIENDLDVICEECKKEDESVTENLILTGYKLCKSCRLSKTLFPI